MKKLKKDVADTYELLSNKELLSFMDHHSREYNRLKKIAIRRNIFKKKLLRKDDVEVMNIITESENINQCLRSVYAHQKRVGSSGYQRISRLMVSHNLKFKDGSIYIHPAHVELFAQGKKSIYVKPLNEHAKTAINEMAEKNQYHAFKIPDSEWLRLIGIEDENAQYLEKNSKKLNLEYRETIPRKRQK